MERVYHYPPALEEGGYQLGASGKLRRVDSSHKSAPQMQRAFPAAATATSFAFHAKELLK